MLQEYRRLPDKREEIVYPYIPDPDGEDEGGQASSSLAVSTRWISAAKLLQYDLVTLTQREGGEWRWIILFSKGCPNPSFPLCAAAAPTQATTALARWQPLLPLLASRLAASGSPLRAPCSRPPLRASRCKRLCPRAGHSRSYPRAIAAPMGSASARRRRPFRASPGCSQPPTCRGLGRGLAVGGQPCMGADHGWPPLLTAAFAAKT
ncbi:hypothetical protein GW17_00040388 [Ensete ventricosum]|nr:hypothetical protein GW17_00040388 [Ensete ventricosum]